MGSRSFSEEQPVRPHLVRRFKRGLAGEIADLRSDIDFGFRRLEGEVDNLVVGGAAGSIHVEYTSFDWVTGGHLDLGIIGQSRTVSRVSLQIVNQFNNSASFEVGDDALHTRFMAVDDINPQEQGRYHTFNDYYYTNAVLLRLFFIGATAPTTGYAKLVIYIS